MEENKQPDNIGQEEKTAETNPVQPVIKKPAAPRKPPVKKDPSASEQAKQTEITTVTPEVTTDIKSLKK